jgi:membrane-associated protease RseP (regulator of RpoE activity)
MVRRATLFDVGSAGPIASFVTSLPLLAVGLAWSEPVPGAATLTTPFAIQFAGQMVWLGNGVIAHLLATWIAPVSVGETLLLLHPLALVGWLGLFVTALNLLPLGQLDGGHVVYALAPARHGLAARLFVLCLIPLGLLWWGWWAWATVVLLINRGRVGHPAVLQHEPSIGVRRRLLGWILIVMFFVTFVPIPIGL